MLIVMRANPLGLARFMLYYFYGERFLPLSLLLLGGALSGYLLRQMRRYIFIMAEFHLVGASTLGYRPEVYAYHGEH